MIATLLTIVEREGLDAINMRRIARELDVSPRLIYHHVRDKETMLVILFDEILSRHMPDLEGRGWEETLREVAATAATAYRRYPGVAAVMLARSARANALPHAAIVRDAVLKALAEAGLTPDQIEGLYLQFSVLVLGSVVLSENLTDTGKALAVTRSRIEQSLELGLDLLLSGIRRLASGSIG
ncbi:MAG TPA: TetR family transcriptional regulator [Magnetospirillaceae bacterium]|nr:TetR family transcriptional regulator [Magnetospirillaceae bacterium]